MSTQETEPKTATGEETGQATYSPEDNKLRLYIGWVSKEEYGKLKAEGWTALYKQREAGGGDFAAVWTPERRDTALRYGGGLILDEDMGPAERASDRAERFSGYRDRRTEDATGHADRFDSGPSAHGYQSQARAERAAERHDRIAGRAVDAWSKAEYWQRRTAGVISHALHVSSPAVRMGRIKTLEAELRKCRKSLEEYAERFKWWRKCEAMEDPAKQTEFAKRLVNTMNLWSEYVHPILGGKELSLYRLMDETPYPGFENWQPIDGKQACELYFSDHAEPKTETDWTLHYELRLAYERQMLEAQGGRAADLEMVPGGRLGSHLIVRVNKSPATGRVTSVLVKGEKIRGWTYKATDVPGADYSLHQFETERLAKTAYTPPDENSLAELAAYKAHVKKQNEAKPAEPPLINPTDEDAQRLQDIWNARALFRHEKKNTYASEGARKMHSDQYKEAEASKVWRITQAQYSAYSKGTYAKAETKGLCAEALPELRHWNMYDKERDARRKAMGPVVCKIRMTSGSDPYADRVIVITDKPQKPLPAAVWEKYQPASVAAPETVNA